jgi:hypothetical protein
MEGRLMTKFPDFERKIETLRDDISVIRSQTSSHTWDINEIKA